VGRRHHQVSKFYLKNFAGHDPKGSRYLWVYDKTSSTLPRPQTPENTTVERDYYSLRTVAGIDERLEEMFGEEDEAKAAPIFSRLQEPGTHLSHQEIGFLAQFLALMHVRGPKIRNAMIEHMQIKAYEASQLLADRPQLLKRFLDEKRPVINGHPVQAEEFAEKLRNVERDYRAEVDPTAALVNCIRAVEPLPPLLYKMNWIICDAPNGSHFVTSETPVCCFLATGPGRAKLGAGFGDSAVEVSFPVSPKVLLLLDWKHRRENHFRSPVNERFLHEMNTRMAWNAERFLVSSIRDAAVQALVEKAKVTSSQPKMDRKFAGALISARLSTLLDKV
jgi:hypothetical protein